MADHPELDFYLTTAEGLMLVVRDGKGQSRALYRNLPYDEDKYVKRGKWSGPAKVVNENFIGKRKDNGTPDVATVNDSSPIVIPDRVPNRYPWPKNIPRLDSVPNPIKLHGDDHKTIHPGSAGRPISNVKIDQ